MIDSIKCLGVPMKRRNISVFFSIILSQIVLRRKIPSRVPLPFRNHSCGSLKCWFIIGVILLSIIWSRIFDARGMRLIVLWSLHLVALLNFGRGANTLHKKSSGYMPMV